MQNMEIKVQVPVFDEIVVLLNKLNAEFVDTLNQKDIYFRSKNGLLKLRYVNGNYELIFYNRNEKEKDRWSNYHILNITDKNAEDFFCRMLEKETIVEKSRKLYIFKNTRIHLDSVKQLGNFLELETVVVNGQKDARKEFENVFNSLSLFKYKELRTSYRNLMLDL